MARLIFITGGVVSSLGKGLASAALGALLQARGYRVRLRKLDPYLNVDPGTMSPFQHGEVYVTDDGAETDLDLGHYERFTGVSAAKSDNAQHNFGIHHQYASALLADLVEIREGDALETLKEVGNGVDLMLIDGAWSLYLPVLKLIEPRLAPGAVILGENAFDKDYIDYVRNPANDYVSMPLPVNEGRGNEFTVRTAAQSRTSAAGTAIVKPR